NEQTQRFRYFLVGHEPAPPSVADFTESSSEKDVLVVLVRVIPLVGLPLWSFLARTNWILPSVTKPDHTPGVFFRSGYFALESRLRRAIWVRPWAPELSSKALL